MKIFGRIFAILITLGSAAFAQSAAAQEAPDVLVKRICQEVLDSAKADKEIQAGNQRRVLDLVNAKILPHVNFKRMTARAAGDNWGKATQEQQDQLTDEFRALLVHTYSGAISRVKDKKVAFKSMNVTSSDTEVEIRSVVAQPRGEALQLDYRLEKLADGWKIYDINIMGAWLVETYKGSFASEIGKSGINGLIKVLSEKNKRLEASATQAP